MADPIRVLIADDMSKRAVEILQKAGFTVEAEKGDWTDADATNKADAAGKATNDLAIRVTADSVNFLANGKLVKGFSKAEMHGFVTDGQTGIRVNHNLDVHVDKFQVKRGK